MTFARPEMLWLLPALALLGGILSLGRRGRIRAWEALTQRGKPPRLRTGSLLVAAVLVVAALARPRFGASPGAPLPPGQDLVLLFDVSRSMGTKDAVPDRLAAAGQVAATLVKALGADPANRVAVAAFSGRGVLRYPLTENLGAVLDVVARLRPGSVQPGGTDLGAGLDAATDAFGTDEHSEGRAIVVFSDGEDLADRWRSRLERLGRMGVMVHAVSFGDDAEGHLVPSGDEDSPLLYQGQPVRSRRTDEALEAIARETDGAMVKLGLASADLGALYRDRIAPMARLKREAARNLERPEQFPLFLAAALGFTVTACWPPGRSGPWRWAWSRAPGFTILGLLSLASLSGAGSGGPEDADTAGLVERGRASYADGRWAEALADFEAAMARAADEPVHRYNAAAALFQLGRFAEALELYRSASGQADPALRTKIDYALGNCALCLGELAAAVEHYDRCLASTAAGPGLDAVRQDALVNRQFALERAAASLGAQGEDDRDVPAQQRRREPDGRKGAGGGEENPQAGQQPEPREDPEGAGPPDGAANRPGRSRRRSGGAGGASRDPGRSGGTPDDQLDRALEEIRDAQSRRLPETETAEPPGDSRKDW